MEKCSQIIVSNKACNAIISEVVHKGSVETGGLLLGHIIDSSWYVLESTDSGPKPNFTKFNVIYSSSYLSHLTKVLSRQYFKELKVLGTWYVGREHLDRLTIENHRRKAKSGGIELEGAIIGRINIESKMKLTMYHFTIFTGCTIVNFQVADHQIPEGLFQFRHAEGIKMINLFQHCKAYVSCPNKLDKKDIVGR